MTNADKYLKVGADRGEFICGLRDYLGNHRDNYDMSNLINNYLNKPVKPTLTEDEKVILRNIDSDYTSIGKEHHGWLYVKDESDIEFRGFDNLYHHLFQFIKPRRRI